MKRAHYKSAFDRINVRTVAEGHLSRFTVHTEKLTTCAGIAFAILGLLTIFMVADKADSRIWLQFFILTVAALSWIIAARRGIIAIGTPLKVDRFDLSTGQLLLKEDAGLLGMTVCPIASVRHCELPDRTVVEVALAGDPSLYTFDDGRRATIITAAGGSRRFTDDLPLRILTDDEESDLRTFIQAVARESFDPITSSEFWTSPITPTRVSRMAVNLGYLATKRMGKGLESFRVTQTGLSFILSKDSAWTRAFRYDTIEQHEEGVTANVVPDGGQVVRLSLTERDIVDIADQFDSRFSEQFSQIIEELKNIESHVQPKSRLARLGTIASSIGINSISSAGGRALVEFVKMLASS
jgi:hypothetical protein